MYTISSDSGYYYVMKDNIDVAVFTSLEEAENFIANAN